MLFIMIVKWKLISTKNLRLSKSESTAISNGNSQYDSVLVKLKRLEIRLTSLVVKKMKKLQQNYSRPTQLCKSIKTTVPTFSPNQINSKQFHTSVHLVKLKVFNWNMKTLLVLVILWESGRNMKYVILHSIYIPN